MRHAARNKTSPPFTANKMLRLLEKAYGQVTAENWANVVRHVKEEVLSDSMRDVHFYNFVENELIIQVGDDDTSSNDDSDDENLGCAYLPD
ncbi:unnamed protein product [Parnassius apollo]|uniref:(apollo) hypothetical protein n=1 Tax=Parnassius apollo TaxID=110799 RepID=A0A8S3Y1X1_PARAO|nr:unnamed protein product [Parnassius apollo]